jgi:protein pelota
MKVFQVNLRQGYVKLKVENLDDLWYLSNVLSEKDIVRMRAERRIKGKDDVGRGGRDERRVFTLSVRVEKADFKSDSDTFRVAGKIEAGPEDLVSIGSHHTFNVEAGTELSIEKSCWTRTDLGILKDAEKASLRPKILIVVVDEGEATFGLVRESRVEYLELSKLIGGKYDTHGRTERKEEFYSDTAKATEELLKREIVSAVIVAGAGFEKENFLKYVKEKYPDLGAKAVLENTGSHGRNGVQEVLKRSKVQGIVEGIASARDLQLMEEVLKEIGKDSGLALYGPKDVADAGNAGAVQKLLVCDDFFLRNRWKAGELMEAVSAARGDVHLMNHVGEAGRQLSSIGGIAALLRYKVR